MKKGRNNKNNRALHKLFVRGVGVVSDKSFSKISKMSSFGMIGRAISRYDSIYAHEQAYKETRNAMESNRGLNSRKLSNIYYKNRRKALIKSGLLTGGIITQYFKHKK